MLKSIPIRDFASVNSIAETTQIGNATTKAQGIIPRPLGGISGPPQMPPLWQLCTTKSMKQTLIDAFVAQLPGIATAGTVAARIYQQGESIVIMFSMTNERLLGMFYVGNDSSHSGSISYLVGENTGQPYFQLLASQLDASAKWYGDLRYGELFCQNGIDDPVVIQLGRTRQPGVWRKRGTNLRPPKPIISLVDPSSDTAVQAFRAESGIKMTADPDNFPGIEGNNKIRVSININSYFYSSISSSITGSGSDANPYTYSISAPAGTTTNDIVAHINSDSRVIGVLSAEVLSSTVAASWAMGFLAGGLGTTPSIGLTNEVIQIVARFWDPGHNSCGYEGPSSAESAELVIPGDVRKDVLVTIPAIDTSSDEFDRFLESGGGIRIYKRFGESGNQTWNLMNKKSVIRIGTDSISGIGSTTDGYLFRIDPIGLNADGSVWIEKFLLGTIRYFDETTVPFDPNNLSPNIFKKGDFIALDHLTTGATPVRYIYYVDNRSPGAFRLRRLVDSGAYFAPTTTQWPNGQYFKAWKVIPLGPPDGTAVIWTTPKPGYTSTPYYTRTPPSPTYYTGSPQFRFQLSTQPNSALIGPTALFIDGELTPSTQEFRIGSTTVPGQVMQIDQNRPLPHRYTAMAAGSVWSAGVTGQEEKILSSKVQVPDEVAPEGANLEDYDTVAKSSGNAELVVSAIWSDGQNLHIHSKDGVIMLSANDTSSQFEPMTNFGAVNANCIMPGDGNRIIFIAADGSVRSFNGARYGTRATEAKTDAAIQYIRDFVDLDSVRENPGLASMLRDEINSMIFFWLPVKSSKPHPFTESTIVGFAFDEITGGLTGPFTAPFTPSCVTSMFPGSGIHIIGLSSGRIFVYDAKSLAISGDSITDPGPITERNPATVPGVSHNGYAKTLVTEVTPNFSVWFSNESILETGMLDAGSQSSLKKFAGLDFRTMKGSRAYVEIALIGISGKESKRWYGEIGSKYRQKPHRVLMSLVDTACKIRIRVISGDLSKWCIRDIAILVDA